MPKLSTTSSETHNDFGIAEEWTSHLSDYTVNLVHIREDSDLSPFLKGQPDDQCHCVHWGYVIAGEISFTYSDKVEVFKAGDSYVATPGHTPQAKAGAEFVVFSNTAEFAPVEAHMMAAMQAAHAG